MTPPDNDLREVLRRGELTALGRGDGLIRLELGEQRVHRGLAGEEPLDGHAEAAGDVEQRRNRRIRQVAFQLADVAGGEFALCGQLGQGQAAALAQAADAGAEEVRFAARRVGGVQR